MAGGMYGDEAPNNLQAGDILVIGRHRLLVLSTEDEQIVFELLPVRPDAMVSTTEGPGRDQLREKGRN